MKSDFLLALESVNSILDLVDRGLLFGLDVSALHIFIRGFYNSLNEKNVLFFWRLNWLDDLSWGRLDDLSRRGVDGLRCRKVSCRYTHALSRLICRLEGSSCSCG